MYTLGWYVLATSKSGKSAIGTLGPYMTRPTAEQKARNAGLISYRVVRAAIDAPGYSAHVRSTGRVSAP